jgi:hypothetical protein
VRSYEESTDCFLNRKNRVFDHGECLRMTYFYLLFRFNKNLILFGLSVATHGYCASKLKARCALGHRTNSAFIAKRKYTHAASKSHAAMVVLLNAHPKMSPLLYTCYNYDMHDGYDRNVVMVQEK